MSVGRRSVAALATIVCLLAACGTAGSPLGIQRPPSAEASAGGAPAVPAASAATAVPGASQYAPLTVYGAASLKGALDNMKTSWESAHPGSTLTISTDSSSALEAQIEQGAPADVFLSADTTNPKKLADKRLADGAIDNFASNLLTVVVPSANPARISSPADLAKSGIKVIAAGDDVPITKYATQLVENLAREPGYPPDFEARYTANIASKEDNVKAVVAKVALGEGDAAIVYVTDARSEPKVAAITVPPEANVPATYAGLVNQASGQTATAHAFLDWVIGADGQAILASFGFLPPPAG